MSFQAIGWVMERSPLASTALLIHLALADATSPLTDNELTIRPSSVAIRARTTSKTVNRVIADLIARGLLEEVAGKSNRYRLVMPDGYPAIAALGSAPR